MRKKFFIFINVLLVIVLSNLVLLYADESFGEESFAIHPKSGLLLNGFTSDYSNFQGAVDCGIFTSGSGTGWNAGIVFEKDFNSSFQLGLGIGLFNRSGVSKVNNTYQSRDQMTGNVVPVTLENKMDTKLFYLEFSPEIRLPLVDKLINGPLRFLTGFRIGLPITKTFEQSESIVSPNNATFINAGGARATVRDMASGDINSTTMQYGISAGLENLLKIGKYNYFTQQIVFDYNFNDIVSDANWKTYAIRLDLGLRFSIQKSEDIEEEIISPIKEEKLKEIIETDVIIVQEEAKPLPVLDFSASFDEETTKLEIGNELISTLPLVNSIFFDNNSSDIPTYYSQNPRLQVDMYSGDAVEYHKHILEVIAKIVNENPDSRIMLEGATSGKKNEPKGLELAKSRAESVKVAFEILGIASNKISFRAIETPRFPSNQSYSEGILENQRVDILVTDAPLQEYVSMEQYAEISGDYIVNLDYRNYPANTKAMVEVNSEREVYSKSGHYKIPFKHRIGLDDKTFGLEGKVNVAGDELQNSELLDLNDVPKLSVALSLKNFEALLRFNYNSSDLTEENKILLRQLTNKLPDGSTILIIGSADVLGASESNEQLAKDRAKSTEKFIKSLAGNRIKIETTTNLDKFSDDTSQGRFLNRSIKIRVK